MILVCALCMLADEANNYANVAAKLYLLLVLELQPHLSALSHSKAWEFRNNSPSSIHGKFCKKVHTWQTLSTPNIPILKYWILRVLDPQDIEKNSLLSHRQHFEISMTAFPSLVDPGACAKGVRETRLERSSIVSCLP